MKLSKLSTILLACVMVFATAATASAQDCPNNEDRLVRRVAGMQDRLNLSDEQADKVYEILSAGRNGEACKDLATFSERRSCQKEQFGSVKDKLEEVLTPEQLEEFQEMRGRMQERFGGKGSKGSRGKRGFNQRW